jgi:DNA-directed RNA polymerase subunit RPC12/RpoP
MPKYSDTDAARYLLNAGARPLEGYKNANAKWKSKCAKCGKEIFPTLANILNGHAACVYCSGRKVHPEDAKHQLSSMLDKHAKRYTEVISLEVAN